MEKIKEFRTELKLIVKESAFSMSNLKYSAPHWYPEPDLVPPKNSMTFMEDCINKLNLEINTFTDIRKEIINGDFE